MLEVVLYLVEAIGCAAAGGLFLRGAGGLWSQWLGHDLGDIGPRIAWGLAGLGLPVCMAWPPQEWWGWLVLALMAVLMGVCRGAGWGDSLTLGWSGPGGKPTADTPRACLVFTDHAFMMIVAGPLYLLARAFSGTGWPIMLQIAGVTGCTVGLSFFLAGIWCGLYALAWRFPREWPALGCYKTDPPPFGELMTGAVTGLFFFGMALLYSLAS